MDLDIYYAFVSGADYVAYVPVGEGDEFLEKKVMGAEWRSAATASHMEPFWTERTRTEEPFKSLKRNLDDKGFHVTLAQSYALDTGEPLIRDPVFRSMIERRKERWPGEAAASRKDLEEEPPTRREGPPTLWEKMFGPGDDR